jgi:hypothetical protein
VPGFPIRTPWDHSLVDSSPRPIAASHVLHRLLVPRHPPFALDNLTTENKMLASTVQFSTNNQPTTPQPHTKPWRRHRLPQVVCETRPCLDSSETTTPTRYRMNSCSFRTQQGANHFPTAAPSPTLSPEHPIPKDVASCTRCAGRCRQKTRQCLRH